MPYGQGIKQVEHHRELKFSEDIKEFLNSNKYTFPVVFDENADLIYSYGIQAFPTTFVIDKEGYIAQYVPGGMTKEIMKTLIESVK